MSQLSEGILVEDLAWLLRVCTDGVDRQLSKTRSGDREQLIGISDDRRLVRRFYRRSGRGSEDVIKGSATGRRGCCCRDERAQPATESAAAVLVRVRHGYAPAPSLLACPRWAISYAA